MARVAADLAVEPNAELTVKPAAELAVEPAATLPELHRVRCFTSASGAEDRS